MFESHALFSQSVQFCKIAVVFSSLSSVNSDVWSFIGLITCLPFFILPICQNFCSSMPCSNGGTCLSGFLPGGYRCLCNDGFTGLWCDIGN